MMISNYDDATALTMNSSILNKHLHEPSVRLFGCMNYTLKASGLGPAGNFPQLWLCYFLVAIFLWVEVARFSFVLEEKFPSNPEALSLSWPHSGGFNSCHFSKADVAQLDPKFQIKSSQKSVPNKV